MERKNFIIFLLFLKEKVSFEKKKKQLNLKQGKSRIQMLGVPHVNARVHGVNQSKNK